MFNNLYQIEQAGRQQQQYLLDLQHQATLTQAARQPVAQATRRASARPVSLRRPSAIWLIRLLVVALALALGFQARPAAAATDPGATGGNSAVVDPGNATGHQPVVDPGNATGHQPVIDPGTTGGHQPATDPGAAAGHQPARVAAAQTTSAGAFLLWGMLFAALLSALAIARRRAASR